LASKKKIEKEICEWSQAELEEHFGQLRKIVSKPAFACSKCGRVAKRKKWLCKAKKLRP